jgi:hypothetical protein
MTDKCVKKLSSIEFPWTVVFQHGDWDKRFVELVKYNELHGDCLVPQRYEPNPPLGRWVNKQRAQYQAWQEGESITHDRRACQEVEHHWIHMVSEAYAVCEVRRSLWDVCCCIVKGLKKMNHWQSHTKKTFRSCTIKSMMDDGDLFVPIYRSLVCPRFGLLLGW